MENIKPLSPEWFKLKASEDKYKDYGYKSIFFIYKSIKY